MWSYIVQLYFYFATTVKEKLNNVLLLNDILLKFIKKISRVPRPYHSILAGGSDKIWFILFEALY